MKKHLYIFLLTAWASIYAQMLYGHTVTYLSSGHNEKVVVSVAITTPEMSAKLNIYKDLFQELARLHGYKGRIQICFNNEATKEYSGHEDMFMVSYQKISTPVYPKRNYEKKREKRWAKGKDAYKLKTFNSLVVRQNWGEVDLDAMLKLADYAMANVKGIKKLKMDTLVITRPFSTEGEDGISRPATYSNISRKVSQQEIFNIINSPSNQYVSKVLDMRIKRRAYKEMETEDQTLAGISYYWQNGKYYIHSKDKMNEDVAPLFVWDDVYCIKYFPEVNATLFFRNERSFYCFRDGKLSREQNNDDPDFLFFNNIFHVLDENIISMKYVKRTPNWWPGKSAYLHYLVEDDSIVMVEDE